MVKEGKSQSEIARVLGIHQTAVSQEIAKLKTHWIDAARSVLEGTATEAAIKIRQIVTAPYGDPAMAAVRLRGAEAVLDRVGLPKSTRNEQVGKDGKDLFDVSDLDSRIARIAAATPKTKDTSGIDAEGET